MNIRKSLVFSYLDRYASLALSIVSSMFIARLLTPADIGIYSVTMVLLTFVATVRDMGAGGYLVQEKDLTVERVRAVWAVQLGLGWLLALGVLAASIPVSLFYHEPRMQQIMMVIALNYAINPFGSLTYAWQIREMRFDTLALVRFCATLVGAVMSVYFAWRGYGPISLAYGSLASTAVNALMAIHFRPAWFPWLPGTKEIKRVLAYGSQTTVAAIIQTLSASVPELLLAKFQSMATAGLFSRASGLVAMFDRLILSGISSVATSWFAKQSREYGGIAEPFLKASAYVTAVGWPFALGIVFLAHPTMRILYGDQWDGAVGLTRLMGIALAFMMPSVMAIPGLMALGGAGQVMRGTAWTTGFSVVLVSAGAFYGLDSLGYCLIAGAAGRTVYWLIVSQRAVGFSWDAFLRAMSGSALISVGSGIAPLAVYLVYGAQPTQLWQPLAIAVPGAVLGALAVAFWIKHPVTIELLALKQRLVQRLVARA